MIPIERWLEGYQQAVQKAFGSRILFLGLQGSYGRGEATGKSDIDVVLILDRLDFEDLERYRAVTADLPHRELLCGFVAGKAELEHWDRADRFEFFFDTKPLYGCLEDLIDIPTQEDARRAVLVGACSLYHGCSHNYLHARSVQVLTGLYKSARFLLLARYFCTQGRYRADDGITAGLTQQERTIWQTARQNAVIRQENLDQYSRLLLDWTQGVICASEV